MMIYADDIIIITPDLGSHLKNLENVFSKLREANLKLHPAKCSLMFPEPKYLGFIFTAENVRADSKKTAVIKNYPQPSCKVVWINMYSDVHRWTKSCLACQAGKPGKQTKPPLKSLQIQSTIFERFHIDHLSLPISDGYKHVFVIICPFSLYCILLPCYTTSAKETAKLWFNNVFLVYGCQSILSDPRAGFMSKLLAELCRLLSIKQIRTSLRHPATNSRCKKFNANILKALRTHCQC